MDIIPSVAIAASVAQIIKDVSLHLAGLGQGFQVEDSVASLVLTGLAYTGYVRLDKVFTQNVLTVLVVAAAACWVATAFILYSRHSTVDRFAWSDVIWYLFFATVAVPAQAAAAVAGAAVAGGRAATLTTAVAAFGMRIWVMSEQNFELRNMEMRIVAIVASLCASKDIVVAVATSTDPVSLKVLALIAGVAGWMITILFYRIQRRHDDIHNTLARIASVLLVSVAAITVCVVVTASVWQPWQLILVFACTISILWVLQQIYHRNVQFVSVKTVLLGLAICAFDIFLVCGDISESLMKWILARAWWHCIFALRNILVVGPRVFGADLFVWFADYYGCYRRVDQNNRCGCGWHFCDDNKTQIRLALPDCRD